MAADIPRAEVKVGRPVLLGQASGIQEYKVVKWDQDQNGDDPGNDQPSESRFQEGPAIPVIQGHRSQIPGDEEQHRHHKDIDDHIDDAGQIIGGRIIHKPERGPYAGSFINPTGMIEDHQEDDECSQVVHPMNSIRLRCVNCFVGHRFFSSLGISEFDRISQLQYNREAVLVSSPESAIQGVNCRAGTGWHVPEGNKNARRDLLSARHYRVDIKSILPSGVHTIRQRAGPLKISPWQPPASGC